MRPVQRGLGELQNLSLQSRFYHAKVSFQPNLGDKVAPAELYPIVKPQRKAWDLLNSPRSHERCWNRLQQTPHPLCWSERWQEAQGQVHQAASKCQRSKAKIQIFGCSIGHLSAGILSFSLWKVRLMHPPASLLRLRLSSSDERGVKVRGEQLASHSREVWILLG